MANKQEVLHYPRLDTILMVEHKIKNSPEFQTKNQIWRALPKQVMYQTLKVILDYLEESGKIMYTKDDKIFWTHNPELEKKIIAEGVKIR